MGLLGQENRLRVLKWAWGGPGGPITIVARPGGVGAPPGGYPPSWLLLLHFKVSYRCILENIDPRKIPGQFEYV